MWACICLHFLISLYRLSASLVAAVYVFSVPLYLYATAAMLNKDLYIQRVIENTCRQNLEEIDVITSFLIFKALLLQPFKHMPFILISPLFTLLLQVWTTLATFILIAGLRQSRNDTAALVSIFAYGRKVFVRHSRHIMLSGQTNLEVQFSFCCVHLVIFLMKLKSCWMV